MSIVSMTLAGWIGFAFLRRRKPLEGEVREDFGIVQSAALTLLALVIGFSLSMAVGRYDQRKNYEEEEANAIGTEFLRADLLSASEAAAVRSLLPKYLEQRILFYEVRDSARLAEVDAVTTKLETDLWAAVRTSAAAQPNPVTALAVAGMNDVINTQGYSQAAWWNRIPPSAWTLMIVIGVFCNLLVGYGARSANAKMRFLLIMPLIVSLSFMLIADIDSPRNGIIRVAPQNLISVAQSLSKP
ncbi:bestrophin-like domain [Paraburkholderia sp. RL18-101-BIB-B]|uniref:bestrophin-like domain n=1 Tax=Paraburkholderia sp. RL18-101-BIB-B TaxID=3031634 RepID=UPI0038BC7197